MGNGMTWAAAGAVLAFALSGCSALPPSARQPADAGIRVSESAGPQVPAFATDLGRLCADGLGFPGLPGYERAAGEVHPAVLMDKDGDTWSQDVPLDGDFPRGWFLGYQDDLAEAQLVICHERTGAKPSGKTCAMKDDKTGEPFTVTMYDTTYLIRVLEARTGRTLHRHAGKATSVRCPLFTYTRQGDDRTRHYAEARPTDYRRPIKRFVAPG